jgi:hypothetical protein
MPLLPNRGAVKTCVNARFETGRQRPLAAKPPHRYDHRMPQLKNAKHELFCRLTIEGTKFGWTQADIYKKAGYRAGGHSAEQLGSQLLKKIEIQNRIAELTAPATRKAKLTASSLMEKFERIEAGAVASDQYGAAARAAELQGKLGGLMIDRSEIGGVGEFAQAETIGDVVRLMLVDSSPSEAISTLRVLIEEVERVALTAAVTVIAAPDRTRINESALSLGALRPKRRNGRGSS